MNKSLYFVNPAPKPWVLCYTSAYTPCHAMPCHAVCPRNPMKPNSSTVHQVRYAFTSTVHDSQKPLRLSSTVAATAQRVVVNLQLSSTDAKTHRGKHSSQFHFHTCTHYTPSEAVQTPTHTIDLGKKKTAPSINPHQPPQANHLPTQPSL